MKGNRASEAGRRGENAALEHLESQGLTLLCRNFRRPFGEIDLIMREGNSIVFIEVRVRHHPAFGDGLTSITRSKRRRLWRTAAAYLQARPDLAAQPSRFDVVSVTADGNHSDCTWVVDAFCEDG